MLLLLTAAAMFLYVCDIPSDRSLTIYTFYTAHLSALELKTWIFRFCFEIFFFSEREREMNLRGENMIQKLFNLGIIVLLVNLQLAFSVVIEQVSFFFSF